jgi:hypothetical protein
VISLPDPTSTICLSSVSISWCILSGYNTVIWHHACHSYAYLLVCGISIRCQCITSTFFLPSINMYWYVIYQFIVFVSLHFHYVLLLCKISDLSSSRFWYSMQNATFFGIWYFSCILGHRGIGRMLFGFWSTYSISAYHHSSYEFYFHP